MARTGNGQLTENFHISEFKCKDGTHVPEALIPNVKKLAENLQVLRDTLKEPIHITSAYRTPAYNEKIGGVPKSQHPKGTAADITVRSKTPRQLALIIEKLIQTKKMASGGLGIYPGFVHYDVRGVNARW